MVWAKYATIKNLITGLPFRRTGTHKKQNTRTTETPFDLCCLALLWFDDLTVYPSLLLTYRSSIVDRQRFLIKRGEGGVRISYQTEHKLVNGDVRQRFGKWRGPILYRKKKRSKNYIEVRTGQHIPHK